MSTVSSQPISAAPLVLQIRRQIVPGLVLVVSLFTVAIALLYPVKSVTDSLTAYPVPLLGSLVACAGALLIYDKRKGGSWDSGLATLLLISFLSTLFLWALPDLLKLAHPNGDSNSIRIYRVAISTVLLLLVSAPLAASALYHLLGATPKAHDLSRYSVVVAVILLAFCVYGLLIWQVLSKGISNWHWDAMLHAYRSFPAPGQLGLRNHILGTLLLMGLTAAISLPLGIGVGLYVGEYGGRISGLVRFSVTSMRAISVFILGLAALGLVISSAGTAFAAIIQGTHFPIGRGGTYIAASIFLSFLVIPVVARCTEQGCRSLPRELREASISLGVTPGYTLTRLILPWSLPNIVTGLLIGCAEVAGGVGVIMFIAGTGANGVGPTQQVTTLDYLIFDEFYNRASIHGANMAPYQMMAAVLLLIIALGLSLTAVALKRRFGARFRSGS